MHKLGTAEEIQASELILYFIPGMVFYQHVVAWQTRRIDDVRLPKHRLSSTLDDAERTQKGCLNFKITIYKLQYSYSNDIVRKFTVNY